MYRTTKFTIDDLDPVLLKVAIDKQVESIMSSSRAHRYRLIDDVYNSVRQGVIAEQYLIQRCGFEKDPYKYGDVIKDGIKYEVKAFTNPRYTAQSVIDKLKLQKSAGWYFCDKLIIFLVTLDSYTFFGEYDL